MTDKRTSLPPGTSGHRTRLRQRLAHDARAVEDYEILELVLGFGLTRKDTKPLAKELLRRFGSIRGALDARPDELLAVPGFGPGLLSLWQVLRELLTRYAASALRQREEIATPEAIARLARTQLAGCPHEECWLALLNGGNYLIGWERLRQGNISTVPVMPRDVLERALLRKARGIILIHNHPGGRSRPSQPDISLTQGLEHLAPQMGLRMVDHVIVTETDCYSILQGRYL
ncbi:DNA repair protein RadC [uncultured Desulfovibrio sp.]|uniref:DNA repair protein RadC n=1 Tax=Candidatus Desulfovibrio intestinavium TaxID=2838534 RepID=A0A9D2HMC9_9BACT|nr:DNA repair protein RadC [uncultured Desulfovibrio sp.]HJA79361.1 DNA repair protein RadC [Candidatus Desulfovibrio intestinavium]